MIIKSCELTSFRNIEKEKIEFSPTINVIYGENAQGKTNILEGIYIFARGKSFRAFKDKEIIRFGDSVAYSLIEYEKKNEKSTLGVEISKSQTKRFYKNGVKAERTADIIGEFRAVLFCPSHLGIVSDSASVRRNFLDVAISQLKPVYIKRMARYNSVISNRNAILKMSEEERAQYRSMIDIYAGELASLNADIADIRNEYVKKLDFYVKEFFGQMTNGKETPKITYESGAGAEDFESRERLKNKFLTLLSESYDREVKYGATLFGIHKDDLKIEINGKDARFYASQGQQRSLALAMKMAEGEISREHTGEYPVFLLDDVLSELDINRRKYILSNINNRQVIVTSCEPIVIENKDTNYICVENGRGRPKRTGTVDDCSVN